MSRQYFTFKQFKIYHDRCAMKVGTDGVLIGSWADTNGVSKALDIGAGSGLIAIMLAQRNSDCLIDAVEIDNESFIQAGDNISRCPWAGRIKIFHSSFQDFSAKRKTCYDLIVSNPPYFHNSLTSPVPQRSAAKHSHSLPLQDLIVGTASLLEPDGRFCTIMPVPETKLFIEKAAGSGIFCRRITSVHPNPGKPAKRYLMEFSRWPGEIIRDELVVELERRHDYSDSFRRLTEDFYLSFRY